MQKLLPLFLVSLIMAAISDKLCITTINEYGVRAYIKKEKIVFFLLALTLAVFAGLRTYYNDTFVYRYSYESFDVEGFSLRSINWALGSNPGYMLVIAVFRKLGISTQSYIMFYSLLTVLTYMWFVRKYTQNIWFSFFLFWAMGCYTFVFAAIKQCVAVAFALLGVDRAINKKWIPFVAFVVIGSLFHPYSLMYLITPLLFFKPWSGKTFVLISSFLLAGLALQPLLGTLINITTMLGEEFSESSLSGAGVNSFRVAVVWMPIVLSFVCREGLKREGRRELNLILNLSILNAAIMFVGLFGTANYFARLANYFLVFQAILLPALLKFFNRKSRRELTVAILICYSAYFYYGTAIANGGFDVGFDKVSLWSYLRSLI